MFVTSQIIIDLIQKNYPKVSTKSEKYKHMIVREAQKYSLNEREIGKLARHIGIQVFEKPKGVPLSWEVKLHYTTGFGLKYIDPQKKDRYLLVVACHNTQKPIVIRRTGGGFVDARWFYELVPELANFKNNSDNYIHTFSAKFNEILNEKLKNQNNKQGMTSEQLKMILAYWEKYIPNLEKICQICFNRRMLPRSGAGMRHLNHSNPAVEIRVSEPKPNPKPGQDVDYVTHTLENGNSELVYAMWDKMQFEHNKEINFLFTHNLRQELTHIPWEIYDFNFFDKESSGCQCKIPG